MFSTAFVAAFVLNPAFVGGCSRAPKFEFGEQDLVRLLATVNGRTFTFTSGAVDYELTFTLQQQEGVDLERTTLRAPSVMRDARACGQRTFLRSAHACLDETIMPLQAEVTLRARGAAGAKTIWDGRRTSGQLVVIGLRIGQTMLEVGWRRYDGKGMIGEGFALDGSSGGAFTLRGVDLDDEGVHWSNGK